MKTSRLIAVLALTLLSACHAAPEQVLGGQPVDIEALKYFPEALRDEFLPMVVAPAPALGSRAAPRTPLATLAGRDVPIKDIILSLFSDSDLNVLIDTDINGTATFDIKSTTTEDAFASLLRYLDLAYAVEGDFVRIGRRERRTFNVDLIDASGIGGGSSTATQGNIWEQIATDLDVLMPDEDELLVSPMSGTVEVGASPSTVGRVAAYLSNLTSRVTNQVSLETRILEVNLNEDYKLGVDFSIFDGWLSSDLIGNVEPGVIAGQSAAAGAEVFKFGFLNTGRFEVMVDTLEEQGQVRVLSSPRVATMNNVPANIRVAEQIPVIEREVIDTEAGSRTELDIRFVDAGINLSILPQIGEGGWITCWVNPIITEQTGTVITPDGLQEEPIISTREATTTIRVQDGEAIVIGGLRSTRKGETLSETPWLSEIPGLGHLFRKTIQERKEVELIVIVVPRRIDEAWRKEDLRRSYRNLMALRREFQPSTIDLEESGESYDLGLLSGNELPPEDVRLSRAAEAGRASVEVALPSATITRNGLASSLVSSAIEAAAVGQHAHALTLLDQALDLRPDNAPALAHAALVQMERGRHDEAAELLDRALLIDHDDPISLSLRGIIDLSRNRTASALGYLEMAYIVEPSPTSACNYAAALIFDGRFAQAHEVMVGVDLRGALMPEAHLNLSFLHLTHGELERGRAELEAALHAGASAGGVRVRVLRKMIDSLEGPA